MPKSFFLALFGLLFEKCQENGRAFFFLRIGHNAYSVCIIISDKACCVRYC